MFFRVLFEGVKLACDIDSRGDICASLRLPSGGRMSFDLRAEDEQPAHCYSVQVATAEDRALRDRLTCDIEVAAPEHGYRRTFRGPRPELVSAVRAAAPKPEPVAAAPDRLAAHPGFDRAETLAMLDLEGTPMAPAAILARPSRRCVECGSPVYDEFCTHCHES